MRLVDLSRKGSEETGADKHKTVLVDGRIKTLVHVNVTVSCLTFSVRVNFSAVQSCCNSCEGLRLFELEMRDREIVDVFLCSPEELIFTTILVQVLLSSHLIIFPGFLEPC